MICEGTLERSGVEKPKEVVPSPSILHSAKMFTTCVTIIQCRAGTQRSQGRFGRVGSSEYRVEVSKVWDRGRLVSGSYAPSTP